MSDSQENDISDYVNNKQHKKIPVKAIFCVVAAIGIIFLVFNFFHQGRNKLKDAKVGDVVKFGHYEQDGNTSNGEEWIEWIVLDKDKNGRLLVISKYALDCKPYYEENYDEDGILTEIFSLEDWLSGRNSYLSIAGASFNQTEWKQIPDVTIDGQYCKMFLLSVDEAARYFVNDDGTHDVYSESSKRACIPTNYAINQGCWQGSWNKEEGNCIWWLRGGSNKYVHADGQVCDHGINNGSDGNYGVRPAMYIDP